ncbi:helix-hairpin-helix domain-containing protein [Swaminathania salitolerans]|uniref:Mitomycin resistance protein n=1 Tax=Swaminathania salitolerans TaxID=182838 RepID=A0A511BRG4_9PROT|nr:helix-hairpin-helix domain-containing protein [Swaminathania salitolerans]GBQ14057.1 mitomycin resistance protein [Swaminathania salitolerans LMG 21291]GEL02900.1 hypothetical protein SSA02_20630 [Swaminathania salitolerans]
MTDEAPPAGDTALRALRNIGPAAYRDLAFLGIVDRAQLALCEPDTLYRRLCVETGVRHDPCVHDVFASAIHQARTGEACDWWHFTPGRKERQKNGSFVSLPETVRNS